MTIAGYALVVVAVVVAGYFLRHKLTNMFKPTKGADPSVERPPVNNLTSTDAIKIISNGAKSLVYLDLLPYLENKQDTVSFLDVWRDKTEDKYYNNRPIPPPGYCATKDLGIEPFTQDSYDNRLRYRFLIYEAINGSGDKFSRLSKYCIDPSTQYIKGNCVDMTTFNHSQTNARPFVSTEGCIASGGVMVCPQNRICKGTKSGNDALTPSAVIPPGKCMDDKQRLSDIPGPTNCILGKGNEQGYLVCGNNLLCNANT